MGKLTEQGTLDLVPYGLEGGRRRPPEEARRGGASGRGGELVKDPQEPSGRLGLSSPSTGGHAFIFTDLASNPTLDKTVPAHFYTVPYNVYLGIYC